LSRPKGTICGHPVSKAGIERCRKCWRKRGGTGEVAQYIGTTCGHPVSRQGVAKCANCKRIGKLPTGSEEDHASASVIERLRGDVGIYRKAYARSVKERAQEERLTGLFQTSIARFPALPKSAFTIRKQRADTSSAREVPTLLIGDQQIGESVSLEETNGLNTYNFMVYQERLEFLEDRVVDILTTHQQAPFDELMIFSMGDNVSGVIHEELQKFGHQHIIDQVYLGALTSALFVYRLALRLRPRGIKKIRVSGVSGNHGRLSKQKESKLYFKNFDYLFHNIMAQALANVPSIEFHLPQCLFTVVEVGGQRILQSHGHEMPPSSLGIPLYSINRASAGYQELLSWRDAQRFDYWVMGHFHRPMELDNAIVNGTMVGLSEYGIGRFKPIRPSQKLIGFSEKWGKTWDYQIRLDHAPEGAKTYTFEADMSTTTALEMFSDRLSDV